MPTGKGTHASLAESLIAGAKKHLSNATLLEFDGGAYTPAEVEASLQALADLRAAVEDAQAAARARVVEERAQAPALRGHMGAFVAFVKARFGDRPDILGDFGLTPKKVKTPLTVEQMAVAVAKRKATREARHTMGVRQKKSVKGNVVGISVTPVTSAKPVAPSAPSNARTTQGTGGAGTPHAS